MASDFVWMIGSYIITQMAILFLKPKEEIHPLTRYLAAGTIGMCLFAMYDITQQAGSLGAQLK